MTLQQKIDYLLNNGYISTNRHLIVRYSNGQHSYTIRDLIFCWNSIIV